MVTKKLNFEKEVPIFLLTVNFIYPTVRVAPMYVKIFDSDDEAAKGLIAAWIIRTILTPDDRYKIRSFSVLSVFFS